MGRRRHTWGPNVVPLCDVLREKPGHSLPAFSGVPGENASEDFGSSFHLIKTEDFLRNAGLVGRDRERGQSTLRLELSFTSSPSIKREKKRRGPSLEPVISPVSVFTLIVGELPNHAQGKISPGLYRVGINFQK